MIGAVVPAAGRSRRMGTQKLLLPLGDSTVIARVVDALLASAVARVYVVVGQDREAVARALAGRDVQFVVNPAPESEMLDSVRCGLRALPEDCGAVLVALGDQPSLTSALVDQMAEALWTSGKGIVVPTYEGARGHPLLFSARYREAVLTGYDDVGLRGLLQDHADDVCELPVPTPTVLDDLDRPEDYDRECDRHVSAAAPPSRGCPPGGR